MRFAVCPPNFGEYADLAVVVGPRIVPLAGRRPHNVALAALTLSRLAPGRVVLGAGLGTPRA